MRELRKAADDPDFLLKALGEASGELYRLVANTDPRLYPRTGAGFDDQWSLHAISFHMLEVERGVYRQIESIVAGGTPRIRHVDLDDIPFAEDYRSADIELLLEEFHTLRRHTAYQLWDLFPRDWQREGHHPYRGAVTVLQLVRELYQHDLEHLWQAKRLVGEFEAART